VGSLSRLYFDLEIDGPGTGQSLNQAVNIVHLMERDKISPHFFYAIEFDAIADAIICAGSDDCYFAAGISRGVESLD
jgi:hypothetical protein